jgi:hypothetical protein
MRRALVTLSAAFTLLASVACSSGSSGTSNSGGGGGAGGPVTKCEELGDTAANSCFSNLDCTDSSRRCENKGTNEAPVACCVPGDRGTGMGGDMCKSELDCASGACVYGASATYCSPECMSDSDCPTSIPLCVAIDPSIGKGKFCGYPG